ncbi:MAG TPA: hypothetical protein VJ483_04175 [Holophagaceae bacterium]|nr:hypothetical protein [Holophagaceae bacterium]
MPIYAPTLPPRPDLGGGQPPLRVLMRFDLKRTLQQKLGRFFGFVFVSILLVEIIILYVRFLMKTNPAFGGVQDFANAVMTQGAAYQAGHLDNFVLTPLWFQVAMVGGGIIARDTLYRVRPLMYAHPVRPLDYLGAKFLFASGLPFAIMLPFVLLPWMLSLLIAGSAGPIWTTLPLHLLPAALVISVLMGSVTIGASALAGSPRASFGWVLGVVLGTLSLGAILGGILNTRAWLALSPAALATAWPQLFCGVEDPLLHWGPAILGTVGHILLWTWLALSRTRPDEAVL